MNDEKNDLEKEDVPITENTHEVPEVIGVVIDEETGTITLTLKNEE